MREDDGSLVDDLAAVIRKCQQLSRLVVDGWISAEERRSRSVTPTAPSSLFAGPVGKGDHSHTPHAALKHAASGGVVAGHKLRQSLLPAKRRDLPMEKRADEQASSGDELDARISRVKRHRQP